MSVDWSPADLGRQRQLVRGIALRAEMDRRLVQRKRRELKEEVMRTLTSPMGLAGCFVAGYVIGMAAWRARPASVGDAVEQPAEQKRHPIRLLLAAWLWLRRGRAIFDLTQSVAPAAQPPKPEPVSSTAIAPSEYIH